MTLHRVLAALALALPVLAAIPDDAQAQERILRVRLNNDIRSTDPGTNRDGNTDGVVVHLVEGLVAYREDTSVGLMLAERVEVSPDGLTYTFTLRRGVRFHNGETLTSADVAFVWQRYMRPETNWRCRPDFDGAITKVTAVETPDPQTVVFRLDRPTALFLSTLARTDCGQTAIYHRASLNPDGSWINPVGTGPFRIGEWRRGQWLELLRFADYSALPGEPDGLTGNKTTYVDRVRYLMVPDAAAARAAVMSGTVDVVPDVATDDVAELNRHPEVRVVTATSMDMQAIIFQTRDPLFQDVRLRRAFALSVDVPELVNAVTDGTSTPNRSPIPLSSTYHSTIQRAVPSRNLDEARRLMREAGYRGQTITMIATRRYAQFYSAAVVAQAMAQEAGFNVQIEVLDWAAQLDRYNRGDFQIMSHGYSARLDPSLSFEMITGPKATQPRKIWDNVEAQAILNESMRVGERERRQPLIDELFRRVIDDVPLIALYQSVDATAVRRNIQGYRGWAVGQPRLWGVRIE